MSVRIVREFARVLFVAVLANWPCTVATGDPSPQPAAITSASVSQSVTVFRSPEPFGGAAKVASGALLQKWNAATTELRIDIAIIAACRADPAACESPAAKRMIAIVEDAQKRDGRARIGEINRAVNLVIAAASDRIQYGAEDKWASPLTTFTSGRGDCEDYALAKYAALRALGFDDSDLRLLIVRLPRSQTDHAVLSVRHEGRWLVLDNRRFAMLDVAHLDAEPLFALRENDRPAYSTAALDSEPYLL
ncbi:MAG TPA: transglutaminase-like cysteine peptidase [Pseudorhodoplanes sp.]|nr:transglutaminase-like cysteine peptidase [Pseudorhodoplanes sp.]